MNDQFVKYSVVVLVSYDYKLKSIVLVNVVKTKKY